MNYSRRRFVQSSLAGVGMAMINPFRAMIPSARAAQIGSSLTVIDTHTHFYDPARPQGVPWPPKDDRLLYRTILPSNYRELKTPQPVKGTIVIEASPWLEDNQWILNLASKEPFIVGFVGNLEIGAPEFPDRLKRFAANQLFRGIRISASTLKQELSRGQNLAPLRLLVEHDLSLDLLGGMDLLPEAVRLAKALPDLRLMLDHLAGVRIDGKTVDPTWLEGMRALARQPRAYCKISGLVEGTGRTDGTAPAETAYYQPILDAVWEAFGPDRLVYGSNWPVSERFAPLNSVQGIVHNYFQAKGTAALEKVFSRNAQAIYKWIQR